MSVSMVTVIVIALMRTIIGAKDDWDFRISDMVRNPDGTDI